ncbi:MAG: rhodanese-like domain-containing protein [Janthinobacterium lividum]
MSLLPKYQEVSPEEVHAQWESRADVRLVDVRQECEYVQYHIPGVLLMPLGEISARFAVELNPADKIICICEHGIRSRNAASFLADQGYARVSTMTGGMDSYRGPVESGPSESPA